MGRTNLNLAVLISGRGSNLQALIDACEEPDYPAVISLVISNNPNAEGLKRAEKAGIKALIVNHKDFETKVDFEKALQTALDSQPIDLICLAGFMRLLSASFVNFWHDRIINIHPSLLPDYKGLNTHERVLSDQCVETGCSVHYVRPEVDCGPVIVQKVVLVIEGDTPESLADRVLEQEHRAYPEAVRLIAEQRLEIIDEQVEISL